MKYHQDSSSKFQTPGLKMFRSNFFSPIKPGVQQTSDTEAVKTNNSSV